MTSRKNGAASSHLAFRQPAPPFHPYNVTRRSRHFGSHELHSNFLGGGTRAAWIGSASDQNDPRAQPHPASPRLTPARSRSPSVPASANHPATPQFANGNRHRIRPRPRVLLAYYGYGDLIGPWYSTPSPHPPHNPRKITSEEAWSQVKGPPIADSRERKGDGGLFYTFCRQTGSWPKEVSGWDPRAEADKFIPYMPVKNVSADFPPTVLIHGTADTDMPFEQSELMAREFQEHGVPHQFHRIAGAEHGLTGGDRAAIDEAQRQAFAFVKERLESP